jgi:Ca2+-transporting ATPase
MITGDHPETALYIANRVGFDAKRHEVKTGQELAAMSDRELRAFLAVAKVIARVTPEDKMRVVSTLQKMGRLVAVTGDGVNDAPALKEATVGISMGIKGTDVARDASDIVLANDKYGTIVSAIEYGRTIYDNIRNAFIFLLSSNFNEICLTAIAFIFGWPLPFTTLQILWINIVTDSLPALAFAFEKPLPHILNTLPRSVKSGGRKRLVGYSMTLALVALVFGLAIYAWELSLDVEKAKTMVFVYTVLVGLAFAFSIRSHERIWVNVKSFFANKFLLAALATSLLMQSVVFLKPFSEIFEVRGLGFSDIAVLVLATLLSFAFAEVARHIFDRSKLR